MPALHGRGPWNLLMGVVDSGGRNRDARGALSSSCERHAAREALKCSFPAFLVDRSWLWRVWRSGENGQKQRSESLRPFPAGDAPNVLLIVLDTVRADSPQPLRLSTRHEPARLMRCRKARHLVHRARSTAPRTLASHASMFTGRWPHELDVKWMTPPTSGFPTVAEYLGAHGYATAGFIANTEYCSSDTGLDRGFAHYEDYVADLAHLRPLRFALLFEAGALVGHFRTGRAPERTPRHRATSRPGRDRSQVASGQLSKGCGRGKSRIPRLVRPPPRAPVLSVFRIPQLLRCPRALTSYPKERRCALARCAANAGGFHAARKAPEGDRQAED